MKIQSSFIICLERNSRVGMGMVRRACFCFDASFLSFVIDALHHAVFSIIQVAMYEEIILIYHGFFIK